MPQTTRSRVTLLVAVSLCVTQCGSEPLVLRAAAVAPAAAHGWSLGFGGAGTDSMDALVVDRAGDVFALGSYEESLAIADANLTAADGGKAIYVAKLTAQGHVLWATSFGGATAQQVRDARVDDVGNLYFTGSFQGTLAIGDFSLEAAGGADAFVASIDPEGVPRWAARIGGTGLDSGERILLLPGDTLVIGGAFSDSITIGDTVVESQGNTDLFLVRFNARTGEFDGSASLGGDGADSLRGLGDGGQGSVVTGGTFRSSINFATGAATSLGGADGFISGVTF